MTTLMYVLGARPNFVKMAPVIQALRGALPGARHVVVHTEQHYDADMSDVFIKELALPIPDHFLGIGSGAHGQQTGRALEAVERVIDVERPDVAVVAGDVNSTLAAALAAVKLGVPVAHVEAGLRSFDRTMPEEINRVLVDQISRWCFTHSPEATSNLTAEGVPEASIHFVGNTMIDSLVRLRPRIRTSKVQRRLGLAQGNYILVTLHRPRLVDGPLLERAMRSLAVLSRTLPVVFPVHPRTLRASAGLASARGLHLVPPQGYVDFLALEAGAAAVITDSGGVQEETTFLGIPCFTLRENTERPVTVTLGTNRLLGLEVELVESIPSLVEAGCPPPAEIPGWDGDAAERLAGILSDDLVPHRTPIAEHSVGENAALAR